jgi:hypothetical protein
VAGSTRSFALAASARLRGAGGFGYTTMIANARSTSGTHQRQVIWRDENRIVLYPREVPLRRWITSPPPHRAQIKL